MSVVYFCTGYPGFIATRLIKRLVALEPHAHFHLLVHPSQLEKARCDLERFVLGGDVREEQFTLLAGDITIPGLGIAFDVQAGLQSSVTHVFHLAAIYDLAVPEEIAWKVNVTGTDQVNRWVRTLEKLERYVYFSTAYVSGDRTGRILETDLNNNQKFKNYYERTKFEAELLVQELLPSVPTTIIRPGIVMGDSRTGETAKFDGPYFVMRFLDRFRRLPIPYLGRGDTRFNLVPVDYIVAATCYLAHAPVGAGKVYHLTDPHPHFSRDVFAGICQELIGKQPAYTLPSSWVYAALCIAAIRKWVLVEKETIAYFDNHAEYDTRQAQQDLQGSGITCPDLFEYLPVTVDFYKQHRADADKLILVK